MQLHFCQVVHVFSILMMFFRHRRLVELSFLEGIDGSFSDKSFDGRNFILRQTEFLVGTYLVVINNWSLLLLVELWLAQPINYTMLSASEMIALVFDCIFISAFDHSLGVNGQGEWQSLNYFSPAREKMQSFWKKKKTLPV